MMSEERARIDEFVSAVSAFVPKEQAIQEAQLYCQVAIRELMTAKLKAYFGHLQLNELLSVLKVLNEKPKEEETNGTPEVSKRPALVRPRK